MKPRHALPLVALALAPAAGADLEAAREARERGDLDAAIAEYRGAARAGDSEAQFVLARMHLAGEGVAANARAAMEWFCRAAHHPAGGSLAARALWYLGFYFQSGGGTPTGEFHGRIEDEDPLRGYFWMQVLATMDRHYESADGESMLLGSLARRRVGGMLTDVERAELDRAVEAWSPERAIDSGEQCLRLPDGLDER